MRPLALPIFGQPTPRPPTGWPPLRLAFRLFYLLAALAGAVLMPLWWAVFTRRVVPATGLSGPLWHGHEMLFGFVVAVVLGFVFTAGKTWTGLQTPRGVQIAFLALLAAGACFVAAFCIYLRRYAGWLTSPRVDGQDG